jgi:hypothetical protein
VLDGRRDLIMIGIYYIILIMMTFIDPLIEKVLIKRILPELDQGRKNFDKPHTQAVVHWMNQLLANVLSNHLDSQVLITVAYAHDWGYFQLFEGVDSDNPIEITQKKAQHMERGAQMIEHLIDNRLSSFFTTTQKLLTSHLVAIHDQVEKLKTEEEILIMEADTLGMLDADRVSPTFSKDENKVFIAEQFYKRRLPRFQHQYAKERALELVKKRVAFYD